VNIVWAHTWVRKFPKGLLNSCNPLIGKAIHFRQVITPLAFCLLGANFNLALFSNSSWRTTNRIPLGERILGHPTLGLHFPHWATYNYPGYKSSPIF